MADAQVGRLESLSLPSVGVWPIRSSVGILIQVCNIRIEDLGEVTGQRVPGFFVFTCRFPILWSFAHVGSLVLRCAGGKARWRGVAVAG